MLFFNGSRSIKLDPKQIELLRTYVLRGGMVVFDSIAGSPFFYAAARKITETALPECKLRTLPLDHPFYHMLADVDKVHYPKNLDSDAPAGRRLCRKPHRRADFQVRPWLRLGRS